VQSLQFINITIKAQLWDTAGQERYESMTNAYYRDAVGAFLVYDISSEQSFQNVHKWLRQVREYGHENMLVSLIANKNDISSHKRRVSTVQGLKYAQTHGMDFLETSAKTGENVETAFRRLIMSVSRLLPEVRRHPVAAGLPDGWVETSEGLFENYWTGEIFSERPSVPAPQGLQLAATYNVADVSVRESQQLKRKTKQSSWNCAGATCSIL
jgi:small GTP-binding protein